MSQHNLFSPSSAHRWINCPGSMKFAENREQGGSSAYADDGTASHEWAALCLKHNRHAVDYLGASMTLNGIAYEMDEERAMYVQVYLDWVRSICGGKPMFTEVRFDMRPEIDTDGTGDAAHYSEFKGEAFIGDLKYGTGERVHAERNAQLLAYAVGFRNDLRMLGSSPKTYRLGICQPRLDHISEWVARDSDLDEFALYARQAIDAGRRAISGEDVELVPGDKTCRWCRARAVCPALAKFVEGAIAADFDKLGTDTVVAIPHDTVDLGKAYAAIPLIEMWIKSVESEVTGRVAAGEKVMGKDGRPLKFVEGKQGNRAWTSPEKAQEIVHHIGPAAYAPQEIISPTAAEKAFKAAKKADVWKQLQPALVTRAPGRPKLALGSDERPSFTGSVSAVDDFGVEE